MKTFFTLFISYFKFIGKDNCSGNLIAYIVTLCRIK